MELESTGGRGTKRARRSALAAVLLAAALVLVGSSAATGTPTRVKDINPGTGSSQGFSPNLTNVGGTLFFPADDGSSGFELWKSDGTEAGTVRVKDINPGTGGSIPDSLTTMSAVGGTLFFQATDGSSGTELWKSDGSEAGTVRVKDINPGTGNSSPQFLTNVGGTLFFQARDGSSNPELWKSDGTEAGTVLVKDINPGAFDNSLPQFLTNVGGTLFFSARDGTGDFELWKSDGSEAGTVRVKDIGPSGPGSSSPFNLTDVGGTLFFRAFDGTGDVELWKSDGSEAGTVRVKDINPGTYSNPDNLTNVGGTLFFTADDGSSGEELWQSDGTEAGTVRVKDINPGTGDSIFGFLTNVGGTLFFRASDGSSGLELWQSDGTDAGTVRVKDINPGTGHSAPGDLTDVGGTLFFRATDGSSGHELWQSDGTEAGTVRVADTVPGTGGSFPNLLENVGGTLFFSATDGSSGAELWKLAPAASAPPTVTISTPVEGDVFAVGQVVDADYACADDVAVSSCVGTVPDGDPIDTGSAGPKTFTVTATDGDGQTDVETVDYTVVSGAALGSLAVADLAQAEGTGGGTTPFVVTITRSGDTSLTAYVNVNTANRSAVSPGDYTAIAPQRIRFAPGETTRAVTVHVGADSVPEGNETLFVRLGNVVNATLADPRRATVTITNDDAGPPATLTIDDVTLAEGDTATTAFVFTVTRSGELSETSSVQAYTADGGAGAPGDYSPLSTTVTFDPGETTKTVTVNVNGDTIPEIAETFLLKLKGPAVNAVISDDRGTGKITNDDTGTPASLAAGNVTLDEGDTGTTIATFTITRGGNLTETVQVKYETVNGTATAPGDYTAATGFLTFAPGETTKTVDITVNGDTDVEPDQTFTLKLANAKGAKVIRNGKGTIRNDDS